MFIVDDESEEQQTLRETIRGMLDTLSPEPVLRETIASELGFEPRVWQALAEGGLLGLAISEEFGGAGAGAAEQAILFQELGRALTPGPVLSTTVAASLVESLGDRSVSAELLPRLGDGSLVVAVAWPEDGFVTEPPVADVVVREAPDGWALTGERRFVVDGRSASLVLVPVSAGDGASLFAVDSDAAGLTRVPLTTLDLTRRQADLVFDGTPARLLGAEGLAGEAVESALRRGVLAIVAEQCGGAEHLVELSVDYAKTRYQFGRPIGQFQAVKHRLAEMAFDLERMKSALRHLVVALDTRSEDVSVAAHLAKAFASEAYFRIAADAIQVHGGIGFTWEHQAHLYFRRAKSSEVVLGTPYAHRERMLSLLESRATV